MHKIKVSKFQLLLQALGSRVALNSYFWLFLFLIKLSDADDQQAYPLWVYYSTMLFLMLFFIALSYVNNLVLLPKLLFAGKRLLYFIVAPSWIFLMAYVYTFILKYIPMVMPGMNSLEMSLVMDPFTNDISPMGILADIQTYFAMMVVWVTIFTLLAFYHHNNSRLKTLQAAIAKHQETELNFLKNQLNPHFLFNTLNNLYALSLRKSDEAPEAILKLSTVLRYMLYEANANLVSFEQEKEIMQAYIDIELLRIKQNPNLNFSFTADNNYLIPPLIWLPVLENVFKHTRSQTDLEIDFKFSLVKNTLHLYCKNSYIPISNNNKNNVGGIGLVNLAKRLQLLYPNQHKLTQHIDEKSYTIEVLVYSLSV